MPVRTHRASAGHTPDHGGLESPSRAAGCCLGLCILKQEPHSWQVSWETCLTPVEQGPSWIQGLAEGLSPRLGNRLECGRGQVLRGVSLAWMLMEYRAPTPTRKGPLARADHTRTQPWVRWVPWPRGCILTTRRVTGNTQPRPGKRAGTTGSATGMVLGPLSTSRFVDGFLPSSLGLWNHMVGEQMLEPKFWAPGTEPKLDLGFSCNCRGCDF